MYFSEFGDYAINPLFNEETLLSSILHKSTTAHPAERNPGGHHCNTASFIFPRFSEGGQHPVPIAPVPIAIGSYRDGSYQDCITTSLF